MEDTAKVLLVRLKVDSSAVKTGIADLRRQLKTLQAEQEKHGDKSSTNLSAQKAALKQLSAGHAGITKAIAGASAEQKNQITTLTALISKVGLRRADEGRVLSVLQQQTSEIKKQITLLSRAGTMSRKGVQVTTHQAISRPSPAHGGTNWWSSLIPSGSHHPHEHEEPGLFGQAGLGLAKGGISGMLGTIFTGVLGGTVGGEMLIAGFEKLKRMLEETSEEAGKDAQLFNTLRGQMGGSSEKTEGLIHSLKAASMGLVNDGSLMTMAVVGMRSNLHLSTDEITKLTGAVVRLSVGLHGPKGATLGVQMMTRFLETGNVRTLAYAVGPPVMQAMREYRPPRGLSPEDQTNLRARQGIRAIEEMDEKAAPPTETLSVAMERETLQMHELELGFTRLIQQTPAAVKFFDAITDAIEQAQDYLVTHSAEIQEMIRKVIDGLLASVKVIIQVAAVLGVVFAMLPSGALRIKALFDKIGEGILWVNEIVIDALLKLTKWTPAIFQGGDKNKKENVDALERASRSTHAAKTDAGSKADQAITDAMSIDNAAATLNDTVIPKLTGAIDKIRGSVAGAGTQKAGGLFGGSEAADPTIVEQRAAREKERTEEQAKFDEMVQKNSYERDLENYDQLHKLKLLSDEDYTSKRSVLYSKTFDAEINAARTVYDAEMKFISQKNETAELLSQDEFNALTKFNTAKQDAMKQYNDKALPLSYEPDEKERQLQEEHVERTHQTNVDALQEAKQSADDSYNLGSTTLDQKAVADKDYYDGLRKEAHSYYLEQAHLAGTDDALLLTKYADYLQTKAKLDLDDLKNSEVIARQKLALAQQTAEGAVEAAKTQYEEIKKLADAGMISPLVAAQQGVTAQTQTVKSQEAYVALLQQQLQTGGVGGAPMVAGTIYEEQEQKIRQANLALEDFRLSLLETATPLQAELGQFGELILSMLSGFRQKGLPEIQTGLSTIKKDMGNGPGTPAAKSQNFMNTMADPNATAMQKISAFGDALQPVVAGLAEFASIIGNANLTVGQALGKGAAGGAGLGSSLKGAIQGKNGIGQDLSNMGGAAGAIGGALSAVAPFMPLIGGVIGGLVGMISGIFERAARRIGDVVQDAVTKITLNFEEGSATLATTLTQLEEQRSSLIAQESGQKYGQNILNQMLPQLNQQIAQLIAQQQQIINTFQAQTEVLNLGPGFTDVGNQINQIIQQWNQYISAGGNVVQANQYLVDSFQQLDETTINQLDQSYVTAIQNALQYNDLLVQRQQLVQSAAEQEESIMNQGVLVRQYTTAQSKAFQIGQIENQTNQQLQQLNEQIQVSAYQLQVNQQVFNLTGTRVDLENKLAQTQMQVIDYDMIRISALSTLVQQMGATGTGAPLGSLIAQLIGTYTQNIGSTGTSYSQLQSALAALGLSSNTTAATSTNSPLQSLFNQYYQLLARQGNYAASSPTTGTPGAQ